MAGPGAGWGNASLRQSKFNPEAMVAGHLALYRDLLAGGAFPAKRPAAWMDFAVRAAVNIYWGGSRAAS